MSKFRDALWDLIEQVVFLSAAFGLTALLVLPFLLMSACSGNNPPAPPPVGQWQQNCNGLSGNAVAFPNVPPGACYIWTSLPTVPKAGQTLTLKYSVAGDPVWAQNPNYNPPDINPPTIHLLLWRKGDNQQCDATTNHYRMFAARTLLVLGDNQTVSAVLDPALWGLCGGVNEQNSLAYLNDVLNNLLGAGVTFGGQYFAGHGLYASHGTGKFTVNSFGAQ